MNNSSNPVGSSTEVMVGLFQALSISAWATWGQPEKKRKKGIRPGANTVQLRDLPRVLNAS